MKNMKRLGTLLFVMTAISGLFSLPAMADCNITYRSVVKSVTGDAANFYVSFLALKESDPALRVKDFQNGVLKALTLDFTREGDRALLVTALNAHEEYDLGLFEIGGVFSMTVLESDETCRLYKLGIIGFSQFHSDKLLKLDVVKDY